MTYPYRINVTRWLEYEHVITPDGHFHYHTIYSTDFECGNWAVYVTRGRERLYCSIGKSPTAAIKDARQWIARRERSKH